MSEPRSLQPGPDAVTTDDLRINAAIDLSCRVPLLILFGFSAFWLVCSSVFSLIASLKFHNPNFLADCAWLTYGRVRPAAAAALLYGFAIPSALGVGLWIVARLSRVTLVQPILVIVGIKLWNIGVLAGAIGIMAGDASGYELLEVPSYAALFLFLGYLLMAVFGLLTFHQRRQTTASVSLWFIIAAIFWFPWIFSTATVLLLMFPVRGITQAVIAWWYAANLVWVWLTLIGIGVLFYFLPAATNRPIHSRNLALFTFWGLLLFGSWGGVPNSAPVPAWLPAAGTVGIVLSGFAALTLFLNFHHTLEGRWSLLKDTPSLRFFGFGILAFFVAQALNIVGSIGGVAQITDLTWFGFARNQLQIYGFFTVIIFAAIYHIVPRLLDTKPEPDFLPASAARLARPVFWLASIGILLVVLPFAAGGVIQGFQLNDARIPFLDIVKTQLMVIRITTLGDLLILGANLLFMVGLGRLVVRYYRAQAALAISEAIVERPVAEVKA